MDSGNLMEYDNLCNYCSIYLGNRCLLLKRNHNAWGLLMAIVGMPRNSPLNRRTWTSPVSKTLTVHLRSETICILNCLLGTHRYFHGLVAVNPTAPSCGKALRACPTFSSDQRQKSEKVSFGDESEVTRKSYLFEGSVECLATLTVEPVEHLVDNCWELEGAFKEIWRQNTLLEAATMHT